MSLEGKVVLIVGASKGIGKAYVTAFVDAGATVIALARSFSDPKIAAASPDDDGRVVRWACDVANEQDVVRTAAKAIGDYGHVDVLVNTAGIFPRYETLATPADAWSEMMQINIRGLYLMIREIAPHMVERGSGSIINMSSGAAFHTPHGSPGHDGLLAYAVSKAAVNRMTDFIAEDLAHTGVAVNALRPGAVLTETWKAIHFESYSAVRDSGRGQPCTPEVVGPPMLWLAEQTSETMTGQVVNATEFGTTWP